MHPKKHTTPVKKRPQSVLFTQHQKAHQHRIPSKSTAGKRPIKPRKTRRKTVLPCPAVQPLSLTCNTAKKTIHRHILRSLGSIGKLHWDFQILSIPRLTNSMLRQSFLLYCGTGSDDSVDSFRRQVKQFVQNLFSSVFLSRIEKRTKIY